MNVFASEINKLKGWKWVEISVDNDYSTSFKMGRIYKKTVMLPEQQAEHDNLSKRIVELGDALEAEDEKALEAEDEKKALEEYQLIEKRLSEIEEASNVYEPGEQARAGGFLSISYDGLLSWRAGYVRSEDDIKPLSDNEIPVALVPDSCTITLKIRGKTPL